MTDISKSLAKATGKLAADDKKTFDTIVAELIKVFNIERAPEIMLVNRMVATWMKMRRVEQMLSEHDVFFEQKDKDGNVRAVVVNQLAFYLKTLDADFRSYYRALSLNTKKDVKEADFHEFLNADAN